MGVSGLMAKGPAPTPRWLLFVKIAIIVLSLIVLALSAYAISLFGSYAGYYYGTGVPGFLIFLVIKTWIIYGLAIGLELKAPQYYYRIGFLIAYVLSVIFWLSGWAWAASLGASITALYGNSRYYAGTPYATYGGVVAGAAGIGAIIWILVILNLVFFVLASLRSSDSTSNVELGHQKQAPTPTQAAYPQQQYAQPGYPQQHQQPVYGQPQQQQAYPQQNYPIQ